MREGNTPPVTLGAALEAWIKNRSGISRRLDQAAAVLSWDEAVGPQIAAVTRPESVTPDGVLRAQWATELSMMAPQILARLNQNRKGRIVQIRWIIGPLEQDQPYPSKGHG